MKKLLLPLITALIFVSCRHDAIKTEVTDFNNVKIELIFEHEGCKMYRFIDGGRPIYWSDCKGRVEYNYNTGSKHRTIQKQQTIND